MAAGPVVWAAVISLAPLVYCLKYRVMYARGGLDLTVRRAVAAAVLAYVTWGVVGVRRLCAAAVFDGGVDAVVLVLSAVPAVIMDAQPATSSLAAASIVAGAFFRLEQTTCITVSAYVGAMAAAAVALV